MMNRIWACMVLFSIVYAVLYGDAQAVSGAVFDAAQEAVTTTLKMVGVFCLWGGLMRIARDAGLIARMERWFSPLLNRLFPDLRDDPTAKSAISMNLTANLLGLGNAATPAGIAAMRQLKRRAAHSDEATADMILFVALNSACIRILPTTVAMLRQEAGSAAPMEILPAALCVSLLGCIATLLLTRLLKRLRHE